MHIARIHPAVVVAFVALVATAPAQADPLRANTLGSGTVTAAGVACAGGSLTVEAAATGTVINTVLTGHVGKIAISGTADGCTGGSALTLAVKGVGPTGSSLVCPTLDGTFAGNALALRAEVVGQCRINNYPTNVRWTVDVTAGTGSFSVERA